MNQDPTIMNPAQPSKNATIRLRRDRMGNVTAIETYAGGGAWRRITTGSGDDPVVERADIPDLVAALQATSGVV